MIIICLKLGDVYGKLIGWMLTKVENAVTIKMAFVAQEHILILLAEEEESKTACSENAVFILCVYVCVCASFLSLPTEQYRTGWRFTERRRPHSDAESSDDFPLYRAERKDVSLLPKAFRRLEKN